MISSKNNEKSLSNQGIMKMYQILKGKLKMRWRMEKLYKAVFKLLEEIKG